MHRKTIGFIASFMAITATGQNLMPSGSPLYKLPYKNTYVMETLVAENAFRTMKPKKQIPESFEHAKRVLPEPYWEGHSKEIDMYWKAWQLGIKNVCQPLDESGFVSSYIAPAYNGNIFMWDDAFITMFCRYGRRYFPFQNTLNNFYSKQHPDGFICREIRADGSDCFGRYDPTSTGPNLLPWSEWLYYIQFGDDSRLNMVFPVLAAYYKWLKLNRTWRNGTYWSSGWGTGMDNMPRVPEGYNTIYSNGHMVWLDACLQQIMVANILLKMGFYLERWQEIEEFEDDIRSLSDYINRHMWSEKDGFLYDLFANDSLSSTQGIYAFWALHTDIALNHYQNVFKVFQKTNTFWEYYAPEDAAPGFMARRDFVGWTGLPPIAILIEYIFGIRANAADNKLTIDVNLTDGYGISRYPFGQDGLMDIKVAKRTSQNEKPKVTIKTNKPVEVQLMWGEKEQTTKVKSGTTTL